MPRIWQWFEKVQVEWNELKPIVSIVVIIGTLLGLVFLQMEERRIGYSILKMSRTFKAKVDERRALEIRLAQATRLEKLESMALSRLTLKRTQNHQVIYLNDEGLVDPPPMLRSTMEEERVSQAPLKNRKSVPKIRREFKVSAWNKGPASMNEGARP